MRLGLQATYLFYDMRKSIFRTAINSPTLFMFMLFMFMPVMIVSMAAQQDSTKVKQRGAKSDNRHHGKHIEKEMNLDEVVVVAGGVGRVKKSAFNAIAVDTKEM